MQVKGGVRHTVNQQAINAGNYRVDKCMVSMTYLGVTDRILGLEILDTSEGPCSSVILPSVGFYGTDSQNGATARLGHISPLQWFQIYI